MQIMFREFEVSLFYKLRLKLLENVKFEDNFITKILSFKIILAEVPGVARQWQNLTIISTNNPFFCGAAIENKKTKQKILIVFCQFEALNGSKLL